MLHALVHERDVLCVHAGVDAERDRRGVWGRRDRHRAVGVEHEHLPEDPDVLEPRRALDKRPYVEPIGAGK